MSPTQYLRPAGTGQRASTLELFYDVLLPSGEPQDLLALRESDS